MKHFLRLAGLSLVVGLAGATETENLNFDFLPTPGPVVIDGKFDDWDLSAGVFACGDVENARDKFAVWIHGMYDAEKLYLLARWVDQTPMNNPGSSKGDYGFRGDCLQFRFVTATDVVGGAVAGLNRHRTDKDPEGVRVSHWDCWIDRDGIDVLGGSYGVAFKEGGTGDAKAKGGAQAFRRHDDGLGYTQEIAIPWSLLTREGVDLKPGDKVVFTVEPNFTIGAAGRLTIKDIFKPGVAIDRVFTFSGPTAWGYATLAKQGKLAPRPVRLADGREFPVRLEDGLPVVDWTGLIQSREPQGFKAVRFSLPEDGYVSLNLFDEQGTVVRQLLAGAFYTKGEHEVLWDGLTTMSVRKPGIVVPAGEYSWRGIWHQGFGLRLKGWACAVGGPWSGMGGDHGDPMAVAAGGGRVFLGWGGGEGGHPLVAMDSGGNAQWSNIRGGIAGANRVASDGKTVFVFNPSGQYASVAIYKVQASNGGYTEWTSRQNTDYLLKDLWALAGGDPEVKNVPHPAGMAAAGGTFFVAFNSLNVVLALDAGSGDLLHKLAVNKPMDLATADGKLLYVLSEAREIVELTVDGGAARGVARIELAEKEWGCGLAMDAEGFFYVGIRDGAEQVYVYAPDGKLARKIGGQGGRVRRGPWVADRLFKISGLAVDGKGQLWVAEQDGIPKRFSVWKAATGELVREIFGPSSYGAIGGAVNPVDPNLMVGQGCEWRIDPATGAADCTGVIARGGMGASRFGFGPDNRLYLAVSHGFLHGQHPVSIYERLGEGDFALRTVLSPHKWKPEGEKNDRLGLRVWADANGDGQEQEGEVRTFEVNLGGWIQGWYMSMAPDLSFSGGLYPIRVSGWTACGAPQYDLTGVEQIVDPELVRHRGGMGAQKGHGSADGTLMLFNGGYGVDHSTVDCYEIGSGKLRWTYPSNYTGVHGSHRAPGPEVGMLRGAYDIAGTAKFPAPVGNIWVIPTNKGEWHVLTEDGYYLTHLFQGDPMRVIWPEKAVPGAILDQCPPGAGEEAFGGSITKGLDGKLYVQAGHTAFWNIEVVGFETVQALPTTGRVALTAADVQTAGQWRERYLQEEVGRKMLLVKRQTVAFTGDLGKDFAGLQPVEYKKNDATAIKTVMSWDDDHLYVGWEVRDDTPWKNGADAPEFMYARGDTVDVQLGTDPKAAKDRKDGGAGDLRISIGPYQGKPTAMVYRKVAAEKNPRTFSSGVVKAYEMDSVVQIELAEVEVKIDEANKRYVVQVALPWAAVGAKPEAGTAWSGDFGVTHGDRVKADTVLRSYWNNQSTGLVSDEVFELQMAPANWGEIRFE